MARAQATGHVRMRGWDWFLILTLATLWGSSFMFFELGLAGIPPSSLVALRMVAGGMALLLLVGNRGVRLRQIWDRRYQLLCFGTLGCTMPFSCYAYGQVHVTSSLAGVLNALMPLFTYLVATAVGQERLLPMRLAGIGIGILGVVVLLGPKAGDGAVLLGGLLCVMATVCYAFNTVWIRRHSAGFEPATLSLGVMVGGMCSSVVVALAVDGIPASLPPGGPLLAGVLLGVFGTGLAYRVFVHLITNVGASNASLGVLLVPFVAVLLGATVLAEDLGLSFLAGAALIIMSFICIDDNLRGRLRALGRRGNG